MMTPEVAVIDYGVGNLLSVRRAFQHCGAAVEITSDPATILDAPRVVLPGVGAFGDAMAELGRRKLDAVVREVAARGIPLLGICLGMQMLLDESDEFGCTAGLGLIRGRVIALPSVGADGHPLKIPHIGWNDLVLARGREDWSTTPLQDLQPGVSVYFVHSFMANPADSRHRIADCLYGGISVPAVIGNGRVFGCQFHPEKSGEVGLRIIQTFLDS